MRAAIRSLIAIVSLALVGGASADTGAYNWMREYVKLRVAAVSTRASGESAIRSPEPKIVGGIIASNYIHKFQVGILQRNITNNRAALFCGGTLVKPNFIVTAAHCSEFFSKEQVQVLTGTHTLDGTGVRRNVEKIFVHPNFNPATLDFDVAVWKLASSATGIPLASIAEDDAPVGTTLKTSGWGYLSFWGEVQSDLRQVNIPRVSRADCNDEDSYNHTITGRMICAGFQEGGKDSCRGDSGGPLTRNVGSGYNVLEGIVSWGDDCAAPEKFGVYTRVAAPSIRSFILDRIKR